MQATVNGKRIFAKLSIVGLLSGAVFAAAIFIANNQPWGYIATPALSSGNFSKGTAVSYTPWFQTVSFKGDLLAMPISKFGVVNVLNPLWRAGPILDAQNFNTGRRIVTTDGAGTATSFQFPALTPAQQAQVGSQGLVDFIRGDRSNERPGAFRQRASVLGDIVHSNPVFVGKPLAGYADSGYLAYASASASRAPRVFVGANDGMLHAFDAASGREVFAYVPSMVIGNLPKLAADPYKHTYFVDGQLTASDAKIGSTWGTVLVGGTGAGAKGYFALDVSDPAAATESQAAAKILWEFHSGSLGAANLGYGYSRPSIVKLNSGDWAAAVGNGYLSTTGAASLYLLNIQTGAVIRELIVPDMANNGLSSPTLIDTNGDRIVDAAYAGDLNGNLWKFDLNSTSPSGWSVSNGTPLFQTAVVNGARQAITTAPEVGRHPDSGYMVYIATGRLLGNSDVIDKSQQSVYGLWDDASATGNWPISMGSLVKQQLVSTTHSGGASVRTATDNRLDWSVHRGWVTPVQIVGAGALDQGERVIQDIALRDNRISFTSVNPTIPTGENWFMQLNAFTGGAPPKTVVDVNKDFVLDVLDNADGNGDGVATDVPVDRVVGQFQNFGLASRPVVGALSTGSDAALINHLVAISPADPPGIPTDPGLLGGHFDLDTSSAVYPFNGGVTDTHVHMWDDKNNLTTIDYFAIAGDPALAEINNGPPLAVAPTDTFILTVANDELSPGGVLEINGSSVSVGDYRAFLDRYLNGALLPNEKFPVFSLNPVMGSPIQGGKGKSTVLTQLTSLKLSFDAFAIIAGDLVPTQTGCMKKNVPGALGEYRNGALLLQALDASDLGAGASFGHTLNAATQSYDAPSSSVDGPLGYARAGLLWESTVFWHWEGPCYGDPAWAPLYDSCVVQGLGGCTKSSKEDKEKSKKKKKKKKKKDDDDDKKSPPPPVPVPPPAAAGDPGNTVTNTTVGGNNDLGRLAWKELVPQD